MVESPFDAEPKDRSIFSAAKLAFFKVALKKKDVNTLYRVNLEGDEVALTEDGLGDAVREASTIAILLHGITGDATAMSSGLRNAGDWLRSHDLVLAYDYENLNTPIEDTALALKEALLAAGIPTDGSKRVTLVGHSLGGLLARWFIEWNGGNQMVDRCILIGTPSGGSMYGQLEDYRKYASTALDLAINFIPNIVPFSGYVLKFLKGLGELTGTMGQMKPGSEFLDRLNSSPDPGVDYTIVYGDHSLVDRSDRAFAFLANKMSDSKQHDLFATTDSTSGTAFADGWSSPVDVKPALPCHHFNYFAFLGDELLGR